MSWRALKHVFYFILFYFILFYFILFYFIYRSPFSSKKASKRLFLMRMITIRISLFNAKSTQNDAKSRDSLVPVPFSWYTFASGHRALPGSGGTQKQMAAKIGRSSSASASLCGKRKGHTNG
jgi:hypothetical protein